METVKLAVRVREETGDGPSGRLRAAGQIPGVTYGKGVTGTPITINFEDFRAALAHGHNVVLELDFGAGKKGAKGAKAKVAQFAVIKEIQFHPTRRQVLHVDLHEVDLAVEIEAPVAIELIGIPIGVTESGGMLDWMHREVVVRALPGDIPVIFQIDVSDLQINHHASVSGLVAPPGVTIVDDPETVIAAVLAPRAEVEVEVEEVGEVPEEPEVIGGTKTEE